MAPGDGEQLSGDDGLRGCRIHACAPGDLRSSASVCCAEAELRRKAAAGTLTDSEATQLNRLKGKGAAPVEEPEVLIMSPRRDRVPCIMRATFKVAHET
jgi:hypothetical protein